MTDGGQHVRLWAGVTGSGSPAYEVVPARHVYDADWEIAGTPALAEGCAAGDIVRLAEDGQFEVIRRGGNVGVVAFGHPGWDVESGASELAEAFGDAGQVEVDPRGRWCVATIPVGVGFAWLEKVLGAWCAATGASWSYTNVYDGRDQPLNWWL